MSLLAVVSNPRRRRRRKSAKRSHRARRRMTAKQLKYFGPRRHRRVRRKARTINIVANPRRRSRVRVSGRRRYRRNPAAALTAGAPRLSSGYVMGAVQNAGIGAVGAVATDLAMTQAARFLPPTMTSRMDANGGVNFAYYGVKSALAIGLGVLAGRFLKGGMRSAAAKGVAGALTVQGYELMRSVLPADLVLGYMTPAPIAGARRMAAYSSTRRLPNRMGGMGAYYPISAGSPGAETRVGEGAIR